MNAATPSRGEAEAEVEELAGLLPESAEEEWELPPGRHLHHKDFLMQQIDRDSSPATDHPRSAPASPRRRFLRPAVLLPATVLALTGGILAATLTSGDAGGVRDMGAGPAVANGAPNGAAGTLGRIANASLNADTKPVKDGQFVYVRSLVRENKGEFDGPVKLGAPHKREVWMSQNPAPVTDIGMIRESGKGVPMPGQDVPIEASGVDGTDDTGAIPAGPDRPTYAWLASLPTDPDALLKKLYAQTRVSDERETKAQAVFGKIGELLEGTIMPPENAAALYKAVAKLPGVTEVPDAVDAAGRRGIGITLEQSSYATRDEWIFDKKTFAYLGSRAYMTKDHKPDKAGGQGGGPRNGEVLLGSNAVLERAVVDQRGMEPAAGRG
ncbi:CU044_5270 family protein [Streptomyces sp. NPDC021622]|uniref:CU044_5270 family protein n=1 Tax=Streptomyces sp. NPDC021622 TaxID=3155013 RepID=UPI00340C1B3D